MTKHDAIIADLMNALDSIQREARKEDASRHYIDGVATQAMRLCDAQRVRNSDGYLVVRVVPPYAVRKQLREDTLKVGR